MPDRVRGGRLRGPVRRPGRTCRWPRPATTPSIRCAWTRGTGRSGPTSPPTTTRWRPACGSPASWTPTSTSSAGTPSSGRWPKGPGGGWSRSWLDDPEADDVGWRAGPAGREVGRPGHLGGVVGHPRGLCGAGLRVAPGPREPVDHRAPDSGRYEVNVGAGSTPPPSGAEPPSTRGTSGSGGDAGRPGGLPPVRRVTRLDGVTGTPSSDRTRRPGRGDPTGGRGSRAPGWPGPGRRSPAGCATCSAPDGLPAGASAELESALGDIGREALDRRAPGACAGCGPRWPPPRPGCSTGCPPRSSTIRPWSTTSPGVEALASRQTKSIGTAVGALQLALVGAASGSTLEGGPFLALAIDGVVGQVAAVVHGVCDWYNTGSYVVRRLDHQGLAADVGEVRRLTNAALMSKGTSRRRADARPLHRVPADPPVVGQRPGRRAALRVVAG